MSQDIAASSHDVKLLLERTRSIRHLSEQLCESLEPEDMVIQSMPDVSPTRWHLAHTTWFFETFLLKEFVPGYKAANAEFETLFNSYYNTVGEQFPRHQRGLLSRPTVREILEYRKDVDATLFAWIRENGLSPRARNILEIGVHHEQQHQELMLTDIKHVFSCNPLLPNYCDSTLPSAPTSADKDFVDFEGGLLEIGAAGDGFCYDNELPAHRVYLQPFQISNTLLTCQDVIQFIEAGGYERPDLWLSAGWQTVTERHWKHPLYWQKEDSQWFQFTLSGLQSINPHEPACHLSYFEADAIARFFEARLPTESEWEIASQQTEIEGSFIESGNFHPVAPPETADQLAQMFGEVWQWTASQYMPYPGYTPPAGALGEYNGKFMCNQFVLRGGSCATSQSHIRRTYRNFFPPDARWQFSGVRLAR